MAEVVNIAYFGDSTIQGWDGAVEADGTMHLTTPSTYWISLSGYTVLNFGIGGQTLENVLDGVAEASWVPAGRTVKTLAGHVADLDADSIVVIEGGINDATLSNATFSDQLDEAIDIVLDADMTCILQTPNRCIDARADDVAAKAAVIRARAKARYLGCIDIHNGTTIAMGAWSYGAHPVYAGYQTMGQYANYRIPQILDPDFPARQVRIAAAVAALEA